MEGGGRYLQRRQVVESATLRTLLDFAPQVAECLGDNGHQGVACDWDTSPNADTLHKTLSAYIIDDMNFKLDNWVEHPSFGRGQIREDRGDNIFIRFVDVGEKLLIKTAKLTPCSAPAADFAFPAAPRKARRSTKAVRSPLPPATARELVGSQSKA